ncbi:MAG: hypothetical protein ACOYA8_02605 [Clostridium sp.]|jgi:hypothetical protein
MSGRIIEYIWMLRGYMAFAAGFALILGLVYRLSLIGFGWGKRRLKIQGLFIEMNMSDQIRLCSLYLRLILVMYTVATMTVSRPVYPAMLICFGGILGLSSRRIRGILEETGNTVLLLGGLYAEGLLLAYMREIRYENSIFAVYVLAGLFMALYTLYFFLRDIKNISEGRQKKYGNLEKKEEEGS